MIKILEPAVEAHPPPLQRQDGVISYQGTEL